MTDLERVDRAQLENALTGASELSRKSLSSEDSALLLKVMVSLVKRYPTQDQETTAKEYFQDYERLALMHSLQKVLEALDAMRVDPDQAFFPRPDEVAAEIERQRERRNRNAVKREGAQWLEEQKRNIHFLKTDPDEIAFRKERFGYDPFREPPPLASSEAKS